MTVSFIGAGKVGTALGKYFSEVVQVDYYLSQSIDSAKKASEYVGCDYTESLEDVLQSNLVFITTQDANISNVVERLLETELTLDGKTIVHTSGAHASSILNPLKDKGARVHSLHPLQAFSDVEKSVKDLEETYFSIEPSSDVLSSLLDQLGNSHFDLTPEQKVKYHLSAVVFSNYMVTLMAYGQEILSSIGLENGIDAMKPLINNTLSNIYMKGPKDALTGPLIRGDLNTLKKHMEALEGLELESYKLLGKLTTELLVEDDENKVALEDLWRLS